MIRLANLESQKVDEEGTTALQVKMDRLAEEKGVEYPPFEMIENLSGTGDGEKYYFDH